MRGRTASAQPVPQDSSAPRCWPVTATVEPKSLGSKEHVQPLAYTIYATSMWGIPFRLLRCPAPAPAEPTCCEMLVAPVYFTNIKFTGSFLDAKRPSQPCLGEAGFEARKLSEASALPGYSLVKHWPPGSLPKAVTIQLEIWKPVRIFPQTGQPFGGWGQEGQGSTQTWALITP